VNWEPGRKVKRKETLRYFLTQHVDLLWDSRMMQA